MNVLNRRQILAALMTVGCSSSRAVVTRSLTMPASEFVPRTEYPAIPPLADDVYARRREHALSLMNEAKADLLFVASGTSSFAYLVGADFGRSERLIALTISASAILLFAPSFEVSRIEKRVRGGPGLKVVGWEENEDPTRVIASSAFIGSSANRPTTILVDPHTEFGTLSALGRALSPEAKLLDGTALFEELRVIKTPEEIVRMKRAIAITEDAFVATFDQLEVGMREKDVSKIAREEQTRRGGDGGYALVQFGESAAFPHGAPTSSSLKKDTVVLMDGGCSFQGWNSDVTRTRWFGDRPSARFRAIYNIVHDAQTAAMERVKPGVPAQEIDRAARAVITRAGFGPQFTHRLGHGIGLEGHEPIYMVEGNERALRPGMVFTIEPGIYLPQELGVRIEDQVMCTETGIEILTQHRAPRL